MANYVSEAVINRLPRYYRHLRELEADGVVQISSQELGERMNLTPSQIRQDINCFGGFGRQGYGYRVSELKVHIGEILGIDHRHKMIIIGAGNIGTSIVQSSSFSHDGFSAVALFDTDPEKTGTKVGSVPVLPMDELETFIKKNRIDIGIIATPAKAAQETLDRLYAAGIRGVWNFAPVDMTYPEDMVIVSVHLSDSLQTLSFKMEHKSNEPVPGMR